MRKLITDETVHRRKGKVDGCMAMVVTEVFG